VPLPVITGQKNYKCVIQLCRARYSRGAFKKFTNFSLVREDRVVAILQQTSFCICVFEMLFHFAGGKKKQKSSVKMIPF